MKLIVGKSYKYVCVPRKRLKDYLVETGNNVVTIDNTDEKHQVKLSVFHPWDIDDTWMYIQSDGKRQKEESMNRKLQHRFEQELKNI